MTFTRGSGGPRAGQSSFRGLAPVRLDGGGGSRRFGTSLGPRSGGPRGFLSRFFRRVFGRGSPLRHLDWILLAGVLALSLLGTLLVYSSTAPSLRSQGLDPRTYLMKQLLNIAIGLVLMAAVAMMDYRQVRAVSPVVLAVSCLGLLVVLTPLGSIVNGAKSWISLPGGFQIEPSEYAKIAIILVGAILLGEIRPGETRPGLRSVWLTVAVAAVPIGLVAAEPDLGVDMLMLALLIGAIALSGVRLRWLGLVLGAGVLGIVAVAKLHLLKPYQVARLTSFLNPNADPRGTGYSARQSLISIGSGGIHGQGLFKGQLIAGNFVPEQHTDFIFSAAGEELGFIGSIVILALLAVVLLRAFRIAAKADDQFGMLVAAGIAIWFGVQSFINIGMTIGIMPVTGLPLPFVSYGGSAMFADMIAIGMLQAVYRHRLVFGRL
jgi:rod shape determining protein RodA